ncbi:unnamed protein product, partial [Prorocentrum cordatum]
MARAPRGGGADLWQRRARAGRGGRVQTWRASLLKGVAAAATWRSPAGPAPTLAPLRQRGEHEREGHALAADGLCPRVLQGVTDTASAFGVTWAAAAMPTAQDFLQYVRTTGWHDICVFATSSEELCLCSCRTGQSCWPTLRHAIGVLASGTFLQQPAAPPQQGHQLQPSVVQRAVSDGATLMHAPWQAEGALGAGRPGAASLPAAAAAHTTAASAHSTPAVSSGASPAAAAAGVPASPVNVAA